MASSSNSSASSSSSKKLVLRSSDNELYYIEEKFALQSLTIKHMIAEIGDIHGQIPLPNVSGKILAKVLEYCKKYHSLTTRRGADIDKLKQWEEGFLSGVDQDTLFDLILAANYMDIKSLLDLTCKHVANMIIGKSPEEIRKKFNIKNDYTPEQEEKIRRQNPWAFDGPPDRK